MIVVTGGGGTVGHHVVRHLLASGEAVRVLREPGDGLAALASLRGQFETVEGDIRDPDALAGAFARARAVIHAAGLAIPLNRFARVMQDVNVRGSTIVARAARAAGVERFVHVSSAAAIGYPGQAVLDEAAAFNGGPDGLNIAYAISKVAAEATVRAELGDAVHLVIVNPGAVVSPYSNPNWGWGVLIDALAAGRVPFAPAGGVGFTGGPELAAACVAALSRGRHAERYLIVSENLSYAAAFALIAELAGRRPPPWVVPRPVLAGVGALTGLASRVLGHDKPLLMLAPETVRLLGRRLFYSAAKARAELGFAPGPLAAAICETLDALGRPAAAVRIGRSPEPGGSKP